MANYSAKYGDAKEYFMGFPSYLECLSAIAEWWSSVNEEEKHINIIVFGVDDDDGLIQAEVYWHCLNAELKVRIEQLLA